jgi:hypothetical protein
MVTALATEKLFANAAVEMFYHAPADASSEQSVKAGDTTTTWKAMRDYEGFAVLAMTALKAGNGMIELSIYAATSSAGADAHEIKTTGVIAADAIGDYAALEVSAEEVAQMGVELGHEFTHLTAYVDCHHANDEVAVVYIRYGAKRAYTGMTATTISA